MLRTLTGIFLAVLVLTAAPAWADTLQVTGGNFTWFSGAVSPGLLGTINGSNFSYSVNGQHLLTL